MKKTLVKIFGVAVVIALLVSMLVAFVPASALTVSSVTAFPPTISSSATYTINMTGNVNLKTGTAITATSAVASGDIIHISTAGSPTGTFTANTLRGGVLTAWASGNALLVNDVLEATGAGAFTALGGAAGSANPDTITVTFPAGTVLPGGFASANVSFNPGDGSTATTTILLSSASQLSAGIVQFLPSQSTVNAGFEAQIGNLWTTTILSVTNPGSSGSFSLNVYTSKETAPVTATYMIVSPGSVQVYNQQGNYVTQAADFSTLGAALATDYTTFKVAPGGYGNPGPVVVSGNYVTITSTGPGVILAINFNVTGTYATISNVTLAGSNAAIDVTISGAYATLTNISFIKTTNLTAPVSRAETLLQVSGTNFTMTGGTVDTSSPSGYQDIGISLTGAAAGANISGVAFKEDQSTVFLPDSAIATTGPVGGGYTILNNTFTGVNGGVGISDLSASGAPPSPVVIVNNTFTALNQAIIINGASNASISGNTITGSVTNGTTYQGAIQVTGTPVNTLTIAANTVKDNTGYSVVIAAAGATSPTITGNNFSGNAKGFQAAGGLLINAILNYWGAPSGPNDATMNPMGTGDLVVGNTNVLPFLGVSSTVGAAFIAPTAAAFSTPTTPPPASGVAVLNYLNVGGVIIGQTLTADPVSGTPALTPIAYYDVYTSLGSLNTAATGPLQINLYNSNIDSSTNVYVWSAGQGKWLVCSNQGVAGVGGYVYFLVGPTINNGGPSVPALSDLTGTYFALVKGVAPAPTPITIASPALGGTSGLTNVPFAWAPVAGATSYQVVLSANADYSTPIATQTVTGTGYVYTGTLAPGAYYWQVTALQATQTIASGSGIFVAAPPTTSGGGGVTVTSTQVTETTTVTTTNVTTTSTQVVITQPAAVTPAWIWGIIGIGAVLIIVVIVLIVRTRRTV